MSWTSFDDLEPGKIDTIAELALQLGRLRVRAGGLPLRYFEKWADEQRKSGRRAIHLSRTNISDALNGKRLPRKEFVLWFVEACGVPADRRNEWLRAWERAADHRHMHDRYVSTSSDHEVTPASQAGEANFPSAKNSVDLREVAEGAEYIQPVFVSLLITTVFMTGREVGRRVTERLVTARRDNVSYYSAIGTFGKTPRTSNYPTRALWGCEAEIADSSHPRWPATLLRFPQPLMRGQSAHFASEVSGPDEHDERWWIDVHVDHHGIAQGEIARDGLVPVQGLAIRIRFDVDCIPEAVWWYAEMGEADRYVMPDEDDARLLTIMGRDVQYTFTESGCRRGQHYGLAFKWPLV
jgi:hypothetical protein